jgi:hypothetical protein
MQVHITSADGTKQANPTASGAVPVGGNTFGPLSVEKTRPADTNAYAANDAIAESASAGTVWTFAVALASGGTGIIYQATIATDDATGVARLELDLYAATPTAINDNAEATRLYVDQANYLGTISFPALAKKTTNSTQAEAVAQVQMPFKASGSVNLFGILRTLDAFTPVSGKKYRVNLYGVQD